MAEITVNGRRVVIELDADATGNPLWQAQAVLTKALSTPRQGPVRLADCEHCGGEFVARRHARFCSTRCRVAASRARQKI